MVLFVENISSLSNRRVTIQTGFQAGKVKRKKTKGKGKFRVGSGFTRFNKASSKLEKLSVNKLDKVFSKLSPRPGSYKSDADVYNMLRENSIKLDKTRTIMSNLMLFSLSILYTSASDL